ncbi:MAG: PAS domain S-box protein [Spirochaetes bacterium]|nr:PAS domain S-box protein [Spirochaetota bacterium]
MRIHPGGAERVTADRAEGSAVSESGRSGMARDSRAGAIVRILLLTLSLLVPAALCAEGGIVSLTGGWKLRKGYQREWIGAPAGVGWEDITVPSVFNDLPQIGGYRGLITLRREIPAEASLLFERGEPVAVNSGVISAAGDLYFNETYLGSSGSLLPYRHGRDQWVVKAVPPNAFRPGGDNALYVVLVIPRYGLLNGLKGPEILIGGADRIFSDFYSGIILSLVFIVIYFFTGVYHLLMALRRPRDLHTLYFALLCMVFSLFSLANSQMLRFIITPGSDFLHFFIDNLPLYLTAPLMALFISRLYHDRATLFARIVAALGGLLVLFGFVIQYEVHQLRFLTFKPIVALIIVAVAYAVYESAMQVRRRNYDAVIMLVGIVSIGIGVVYDWLALEGYIATMMISPFIFTGVIVGTAYIIINRFARTFEGTERLNEELNATNEELEAMNEEYEAQNEELLRSEEELSERESFIRRIVETAPAMIYRASFAKERFSYDYISPQALEMTGYTPEELMRNPWMIQSLIPMHLRERHEEFWRRAAAGEPEPLTLYPIIHRSGEKRWLEQRTVLITGTGGRPVGIEAYCTDVTRQKAADDAIRMSEEQYRSLVENIREVIFSMDESGIITYISPAVTGVIGIPPPDIMGKRFSEFVYPEDLPGLARRVEDIRKGIIMPYDYRIVDGKGEPRWVRSFSHPVYVRGTFTGITGIVTDIQEQRLTEEALRESEERFKMLYENAGVSIFIMDRSTIIHCNRRTLELFGCGWDDIIGHTPYDFSPDVQADGQVSEEKGAGIIAAVFAGEPRQFEWVHRRLDGTLFDAEVNLTVTELKSGIFLQAIVRDISDRKRAEAERVRMQSQLMQAQKMEAIGTLAGGIAHDFNNMLGGIIGSLNLLELLAEREDLRQKEEILSSVETAMESSRRAADLTRQILTLSRRQGLRFASVDVSLSMKHTMQICKNSFPKSLQLDFRIPVEQLRVHADPTHMEQLLLNLCVNASHAMTIMRSGGEPEGGVLSVRAAPVIADAEFCRLHTGAVRDNGYVRIEVEDSGVGMRPEVRERIFDPFFTTKDMDSGTGLGLPIVYNIVKEHHGFIDVSSVPGKGSLFTVYLPELKDGSTATETGETRGEIVRGSGRILVVDDEEVILRISRRMLEQCGYQVITSNSAPQGIEMYRRDHEGIDAVILDMSMPKMSGLKVFEHLKEIRPSVRVLLASGQMENELIQKAIESGIGGFIQKPYTAEELSQRLKQILEK